MPDKRSRGEVRNSRLQKVAADLFLKRGYEGVTVDKIVESTDLAKKYVLKVFPDAIGLGDANREMLIKFGHAQFNMFGPKNDIYRASMEAAVEVFEWVATNCKRDAVQPGRHIAALRPAAGLSPRVAFMDPERS